MTDFMPIFRDISHLLFCAERVNMWLRKRRRGGENRRL